MFKLAESRGSAGGLYCGRDGLFLGPSALIEHHEGAYRLRPQDEIAILLAAAYKSIPDPTSCFARLPRVAAALEKGDLARAMIAALHLRLGEIPKERMASLARAEALLKHGFNPDQPRDWHGRWTAEGSVSSSGQAAADHPALVPVQELLPFGARPPLFFDEPPKTFRPFKGPIPRLSGKEGAKQIPSWARGNRPYVGENGRGFAERLMDQQYGRGNWNRSDPEYNQLKKFGDRNFRDPRSLLLPDDDRI